MEHLQQEPLGISGNKKLSFYASAWNKETMTVYIKVNGGGSVSGDDNITAEPNTGVAGTGTFIVTFTDSDYYTFNLTDLTPESTITIATDANFDGNGVKGSRCNVWIPIILKSDRN
ncbi:hypothetical protein NXY15_08575 [Bacteroides thetaiotaomicron]|nr:hypothetical protein NXY15_08575 [Bacteroides thetaiotaomicron]